MTGISLQYILGAEFKEVGQWRRKRKCKANDGGM